MGRKVRRVPADWQHPRKPDGSYIPLMGGSYSERLAEWSEAKQRWNDGYVERSMKQADGSWSDEWAVKTEDQTGPYEEWDGPRPDQDDYMPDWPENQRTHFQMYEDTTEGTPISPVMDSPENLARWLADNDASAFGYRTATYEQWLATIQRGFAPSAVMTVSGDGSRTMQSGVEALADKS